MTTGDRVLLRITLIDTKGVPVRAGASGIIIGGKGPMGDPMSELHVSVDEVDPEDGHHRSVWGRPTAFRRK